MPIYHQLGNIPHKRHTIFKSPEGKFYYEQLFGTVGFDGMSSLLYHVHRPTQVKEIRSTKDVTPKIAVAKNQKAYRLLGFDLKPVADHLDARKTVLTNSDVSLVLAAPQAKKVDYFYKNADADELIQQVMATRGYPVEDFDRRAADVSVEHPDVVENYRSAHSIAVKEAREETSGDTEALRKAMVYYRSLFDELLIVDDAEDRRN